MIKNDQSVIFIMKGYRGQARGTGGGKQEVTFKGAPGGQETPLERAVLEQPSAVRHGLARLHQHDLAVGIGETEGQHLRDNGADLARREIHDRSNLLAHQRFKRMVFGDLRRALAHADRGTEIDPQPPGRLARLRERLCIDDGADADIDREKSVEVDGRRRGRGWIVGDVHGVSVRRAGIVCNIVVRTRVAYNAGALRYDACARTVLPNIIYGIKNCDTMKNARVWLDTQGVAYAFHDYKTAGVDKDKLKQWSDKVGWETLLNRAGTTFKKLPDADKEGLCEKKALALMLAQPSMIKRPVLEVGGKLLVGFKPDIYAKEVTAKEGGARSR